LDLPRKRRLLTSQSLLAFAVLMVYVASGAAGVVQTAYGQSPSVSNPLAAAQTPSIDFGVVFIRASYGGPETSYNTVAVLNADLNMLLATNVRCIRIDIGYAPWLQKNQTAINEMTGLVQAIKAAGKCLIIADAASETYRKGGQLTWSQFLAAWGPRVSTLAALYQPDYYVVIKEPGWYVPMVSDASTNPQFQSVSVWLSLTQNLTNAVHEASPSTVVGVAIAANSLTQANGAFFASYLNQVQAIQVVSFIGFDTYGQSDQTATQNYLSKNPPSKAVWIPEAWSTATGAPLGGQASQDTQWLQSMYNFAVTIHASFLIPFYTDHFASYSLTASSPTNSAEIISLYQQRTPIFSTFQSLVAAAIGLSTTSSTSSTSTSSAPSSSTTTSTSSASSSATTAGTQTSTTQTTHSSTASAPSGGNGLFSPGVVALEIVVLLVIVAAVFYLRTKLSADSERVIGSDLRKP
jgi:hypothetical protein